MLSKMQYECAVPTFSVETVVAVLPGQIRSERGKQVEDGPGYNHTQDESIESRHYHHTGP